MTDNSSAQLGDWVNSQSLQGIPIEGVLVLENPESGIAWVYTRADVDPIVRCRRDLTVRVSFKKITNPEQREFIEARRLELHNTKAITNPDVSWED